MLYMFFHLIYFGTACSGSILSWLGSTSSSCSDIARMCQALLFLQWRDDWHLERLLSASFTASESVGKCFLQDGEAVPDVPVVAEVLQTLTSFVSSLFLLLVAGFSGVQFRCRVLQTFLNSKAIAISIVYGRCFGIASCDFHRNFLDDPFLNLNQNFG